MREHVNIDVRINTVEKYARYSFLNMLLISGCLILIR